MSATNGTRPPDPDAMLVAREDFEVEIDGELVKLKAGLDRVAPEHELVKRYPDKFEPARDGEQGERSVAHRMIGDGLRQPARTMSLEEELRVRSERLRQLDERERNRPAPPTSEEAFWARVDRLLTDPAQKRADDADMAMLDELDAARAASLADERAALSDWLDK